MITDLSFHNSSSAHSTGRALLYILMNYLKELWMTKQKSHILLLWHALFIFNKMLSTTGKANRVASYLWNNQHQGEHEGCFPSSLALM